MHSVKFIVVPFVIAMYDGRQIKDGSKMQNLFVNAIASVLLLSTPSIDLSLMMPSPPLISPSLMIPRMEPKELQSRGEMIMVKPEEKLQYLLDQCNSLDDIEEMAKSFDAVAKLYDDQSNYVDAEICYFVAIRLMSLCLPPNAPALATEYTRLSAHYGQTNQGQLARLSNLKALRIFQANNECVLELAVTEYNQAWLELYVGKRNSAEYYLKHCLKLLKSALGERHLLVGLISNSLAELYMVDENFVGAEKQLRSALEILPLNADTEEVSKYVRSNYTMVLQRLRTKSEKVVRGQIK